MADTAPAPTPAERYATFRERRDLAARQPQGPLALVNTQWVGDEQTIWGVPGTWGPATDGGLLLTAAAEDGIEVDDVLVDGTVRVRGKDDPEPSTIRFDDHTTGFVIAGEDGLYALRVWDAQSDAIASFGHIEAYDYDPAWVVTGTFREIPGGTTLGFEHLKSEGHTRDEVVPGEIRFSYEGVEYTIAAFKSGRALQLVYADATNGEDTYSVGRFLFLAPNADGTITLDFNLGILPPCAFSYHFNCPLPPKQNRFPFRIEAGEKNVRDAAGALLHG
jgi:uncharacterized protein